MAPIYYELDASELEQSIAIRKKEEERPAVKKGRKEVLLRVGPPVTTIANCHLEKLCQVGTTKCTKPLINSP